MDFGSLDSIMDDDDLAPRSLQRDGLNEVELHRQELEELPPPPHSVNIEVERKRKWLRAPKTVRIALRRLHNMTGHSPPSAMVQLLRTSGASSQVIETTRHFACETCWKRQSPQRPNVVKPPSKMEFNHEIAIDCLEIKDSYGNRHTILYRRYVLEHFSIKRFGLLEVEFRRAQSAPRSFFKNGLHHSVHQRFSHVIVEFTIEADYKTFESSWSSASRHRSGSALPAWAWRTGRRSTQKPPENLHWREEHHWSARGGDASFRGCHGEELQDKPCWLYTSTVGVG